MSRRLFFYVQHLLGIGHIRRAATLSRGFAAAGWDVVLVAGGFRPPDIDVGGARYEQLEPVRATDKHFRVLVDGAGLVVDDAFKEARARRLVSLFEEHRPDALITELFPFGRRQMRFELVPLMQAAAAQTPRPLTLSSVRDILVQSPKPERVEEMVALFDAHFDAALVHGDPNLIPFARTFPAEARLRGRYRYTGYVVDPSRSAAETASSAGRDEVIVSAGGGAVGAPLFRAAIAARARTALKDRRWRLLLGFGIPQAEFDAIAAEARAAAGDGIVVERARKDFMTLLANATVSISQGGYNTVIETLTYAERAVIVPYAGGLETEQQLRADLLAERGAFAVTAEDGLTPQALADAVGRSLAGPSIRSLPKVDASGVATSIRLVEDMLADLSR